MNPTVTPAARAPSGRHRGCIPVVAIDDEFASARTRADGENARSELIVPCLELSKGCWLPDHDRFKPPTLGAIVVSGVLACEMKLLGRRCLDLLGPGDFFTPWRPPLQPASGTVGWAALAPTSIAVLDDEFAQASRDWPALASVTTARMAQRSDRLIQRVAALQMPRVDDRLLATLWQLADRFGRVGPNGITLEIRLTHQNLAKLVAAKRPTVTLALQSLLTDGAIRRRDDGRLVLRPGSADRF